MHSGQHQRDRRFAETLIEALTEWCARLHCGASDRCDPDVRHRLQRRVAEGFVSPSSTEEVRAWTLDAEEMEEGLIQADCERRYGPAKEADWDRMHHHLSGHARVCV